MFDKHAPAPARATAEGQLGDESVGEVQGEDVDPEYGDTATPGKHR